VFEAVVAPIAVALAFDHARRALGTARAAAEMAALAVYGFTVELVAMTLFASHAYSASWWAQPLGVPLAVAAVWSAVIVSAMSVAGRHESTALGRAVTAAVVAVALDLLIDPVATRAGLWRWTPPGPWLGVPIGNFVGWSVIVGVYAYGADRWAGTGRGPFQPLRRLALSAACIVVLVIIAEIWTRAGSERLFEHGRGWAVWAVVQIALLWRVTSARRGVVSGDATLPMLLAETPGARPEAALCVVGVGFAIEAVSIAQADVTTAALGSLVALAVVAARLRRPKEKV
jgi:hypothetical protein